MTSQNSRKPRKKGHASAESAHKPPVENNEKAKAVRDLSAAPQAFSHREWCFVLLLVVATILAYQPVWHAGFIWDDDAHLTPPELRSFDGLVRIWTQLGATQQYYPFVYSVFWVEHKLWGDAPLGYHLVNVLLHAFSALLLVKILRQLKIPGAWLAAALFALYPIEVESVAWVSELKNTMSGLCYLGAALAYLGFDRNRSRRNYLVALGLFVVGLLSKTVIATLPGALLVIFWWQRGRTSWRKDGLPLVPFVAAGTAAGLVTSYVERKLLHSEGAEYHFSFVERVLIAGRDIWFYLSKLIWPVDLAFFYPRWNVSQTIWWQYLFPAATLALLAVLICKRWRSPLAAFLFFVGTLFPALGFFNVFPFRYSFVADHFQYLASIGPFTLAAAGLTIAFNRFQNLVLKFVPATALLLVLGILTWRQATTYASLDTLWTHTYRLNPNCWMAHNYSGFKLLQQSRTDEAMAEFQTALKINPLDIDTRDNLGIAFLQKVNVDEAMAQFQKSLEINPDSPDACNNLAIALRSKGRLDEAIAYGRKAVQARPTFAKARYNLALALTDKGRADEAIAQYQNALRSTPGDANIHNNLGTLLLDAGKVDDAVEHFRGAVQADPTFAQAQVNLGNALLQRGQTDEACIHLQKAVELAPNNADAQFSIGNALAKRGSMPEAIAHLQKALELRPDHADAHLNLGNILLRAGQVDEAIDHFQKALQFKPDDAQAQNNLGNAFLKKGNFSEAIGHYGEALRIQPSDPSFQNNLAWLLATCSVPGLRDGTRAVSLAQAANNTTTGRNPIILHTLAAAFAEAGRFPEAAETAQRALTLSQSQSNPKLTEALQSELKLYHSGQPFHSDGGTH